MVEKLSLSYKDYGGFEGTKVLEPVYIGHILELVSTWMCEVESITGS